MADLSIIILNWNTGELLKTCIESVVESRLDREIEIVVVDNNSDEDLSHIQALDARIKVIANHHNHGFAVGNNIGFRHCSGKYVMPLNPDTKLEPDTITTLLRVLDDNDDVGIAVPVLTEQIVDRSDYSFFNLFFRSTLLRKLKHVIAQSKRSEEEPISVEFIGGTGYICRKSVLDSDRIFAEDNFLFGEEYYLCREVKRRGAKILVVPAAKFEHYTSVTFKSDPARLSVAAALGAAVAWHIRNEQWGWFLGTVSGLMLLSEDAVKWLAISLVRLTRQKDYGSTTLTQSEALLRSGMGMLINGDRYLTGMNKTAELFFNDNRTSELSPVTDV